MKEYKFFKGFARLKDEDDEDDDCYRAKPIESTRIIYDGPNLSCTGVRTCDDITLAMQKIDVQICNLINQFYNLTTTTTIYISTTSTTTTMYQLPDVSELPNVSLYYAYSIDGGIDTRFSNTMNEAIDALKHFGKLLDPDYSLSALYSKAINLNVGTTVYKSSGELQQDGYYLYNAFSPLIGTVHANFIHIINGIIVSNDYISYTN